MVRILEEETRDQRLFKYSDRFGKNYRMPQLLNVTNEFESWRETIAVMSDDALMGEIKKGLGALKKKKAKLYTLEELFE